MDNWVAVFETDQAYRAEMVKDILCDHNIEAIVLNQKDSSYIMLGSIRVMINQKDIEKATEILKTINCE